MRIASLILAIFFFSCQNNHNSNQNSNQVENLEEKSSLAQQLIGEWHNVSLRVDIQGDSLVVFEADENNWEEQLGIKIIQTHYREDGTFNSEHFTLSDSLFLDVKGNWKIEGDNIFLYQELPVPDTTICKMSISDGLAYFDCMVDWDSDGNRDDQYIGVQRKQ